MTFGESAIPNFPERKGDSPQEEGENSASVRLGAIALKLEKLEKRTKEGAAPTPEELAAIRVDVQETQRVAAQEEENARVDFLTGLPNRRALNEAMEKEMSRLERQARDNISPPLHAVKIDLDFFKQINDQFGHAAGDLYLKKVSEHVGWALRRTDTFARVGGDEFVVLMPDSNPGHAEQMAERLLKAVSEGSAEAREELVRERSDMKLKDTDGNVSASLGFALFNGKEAAKELLERADFYSYVAKAAGKNAVVGGEMAAQLDPDGLILSRFTSTKE